MKGILKCMAVGGFILALSGCSMANLNDATSLASASQKTSDPATVKKEFIISLANLRLAESGFLTALGDKKNAAKAKNDSDNLKNGTISGDDGIQKTIDNSNEANKNILDSMSKHKKLSKASKDALIASLSPYAIGTTGMILVAKDVSATVSSLTTSMDASSQDKIKSLMIVTKNAPALVGSFTDTTSTLISFAKFNDIDTAALGKVSDEMGE